MTCYDVFVRSSTRRVEPQRFDVHGRDRSHAARLAAEILHVPVDLVVLEAA